MNLRSPIALIIAATLPVAALAASTDSKIEDAATSSYNYRVVLDGRVSVKANDGVVTLTGTVPDKSDRSLAEDTAGNLPGVVRVDNRIVVSSDNPEHSDGWIALMVRGELLIKGNVSAIDTKVAVKDGVVTLTGNATSAAQKDLTAVFAGEVENVKSVTNNMVVAPPAAGGSAVADVIDDASITSEVKYALLSHHATSAVSTKITTNDGVVIVTGVAGSDAEKELVTKLAQDSRGVKSVVNDMTVKS